MSTLFPNVFSTVTVTVRLLEDVNFQASTSPVKLMGSPITRPPIGNEVAVSGVPPRSATEPDSPLALITRRSFCGLLASAYSPWLHWVRRRESLFPMIGPQSPWPS